MSGWLWLQVRLLLVQAVMTRHLASVAEPTSGLWPDGAGATLQESAGADGLADAPPFVATALAGLAQLPAGGAAAAAAAAGGYLIVKRWIDVVGAVVLLTLALIAILAIALVIKLDSAGPVFYRSRRVGQGGRPISVLKFRTMRADSEALLVELRSSEAHRDEFEAHFKIRHDPRRTRVGRFLRRTSLDELPQFWNVIRGEMSLVGPRPIVEEELIFYRQVDGGEAAYLALRPGISGLWQVGGRSDTTYDERVRLDIRYAREVGALTDLGILLRTPLAVIRGRGAY